MKTKKPVIAERSVVGSVILNGKLEDLQPTDFSCASCSIVWEAIQDLVAKDTPIDLVTISTKLQEWGKLEQIGGPEFIAELQNETPTGSHAEKYAKIVKTNSIRREISKIFSTNFDEDKTNEEIIGEVTSKLHSLAKPVHNRSILELLSEYKKMKKDKKRGYLTGFDWLDNKTKGINKGMMWVIAAKSGVGKTTIALQTIRNICDETGQKAILYTLEQIDVMVLQNLERIQKHKKEEIDQLAMMRLEIVDSLRSWDSIAVDAQKRDAKIIVVDYAQMVGIPGRSGQEKMENLAYSIREFCNRTKIAVILISQISEETRKNKGEHDAAKGGGDLFNAADIFINIRSDTIAENEQRKEDAIHGGDPAIGGRIFQRDFMIVKNKYGQTGYKQVEYNYTYGLGVYTCF